jgi:hypothetical protein
MAAPGDSDGERSTPTAHSRKQKREEDVRSVNMHQLGNIFLERVLDVRRRHSEGSETVAPGESLEFLTQIRGWQSEARAQRRAHLMRLSEIGLRVALEGAAGSDVFLVPKEHFADETPEHGDEGWWYRVRVVISRAFFNFSHVITS